MKNEKPKIVPQEHTSTEKERERELDEEHVCSRSRLAIARTRGSSLDHFFAIARTRGSSLDHFFAITRTRGRVFDRFFRRPNFLFSFRTLLSGQPSCPEGILGNQRNLGKNYFPPGHPIKRGNPVFSLSLSLSLSLFH